MLLFSTDVRLYGGENKTIKKQPLQMIAATAVKEPVYGFIL